MSERNPDSWSGIISYCDNVSLAALYLTGNVWLQQLIFSVRTLSCEGRYFSLLSKHPAHHSMYINNIGNLRIDIPKLHLKQQDQLQTLRVKMYMSGSVNKIMDLLPAHLLHFSIRVEEPLQQQPGQGGHASLDLTHLPTSLSSLSITIRSKTRSNYVENYGTSTFPMLSSISIELPSVGVFEMDTLAGLLRSAPGITDASFNFHASQLAGQVISHLPFAEVRNLSLSTSSSSLPWSDKILSKFCNAKIAIDLTDHTRSDGLLQQLPPNITSLWCYYGSHDTTIFNKWSQLRSLKVVGVLPYGLNHAKFDAILPYLETLKIGGFIEVIVPPTVTKLVLLSGVGNIIHHPDARYQKLRYYWKLTYSSMWFSDLDNPFLNSNYTQIRVLRISVYHPLILCLVKQIRKDQLEELIIDSMKVSSKSSTNIEHHDLLNVCRTFTALVRLSVVIHDKGIHFDEDLNFAPSITDLAFYCKGVSYRKIILPPSLVKLSLQVRHGPLLDLNFLNPLTNNLKSVILRIGQCDIAELLRRIPLCTRKINLIIFTRSGNSSDIRELVDGEKKRRMHYLQSLDCKMITL